MTDQHSNQQRFFSQGIYAVVGRWRRCVERIGCYIELLVLCCIHFWGEKINL